VAGVRHAIEAAGATRRYLPPYSRDLNPIQRLFAKLKALLRKAAERSIQALWDRIGKLLDTFGPQQCANYFRHHRYAAKMTAICASVGRLTCSARRRRERVS
jgi:transposase